MGDFENAAAAFQKGLDIDPTNQSLKVGLQNSQARIPSTSQTTPSLSSPRSDSTSGGQGGFPDLASLMNNPAMMQMAQQMMANGGLEGLMGNPAVQNMVSIISCVEDAM